MIQALTSLMGFEEFLEWHPSDGRRFELIRGIPKEMNPKGPHERLGGWLTIELGIEIRQKALPFFIPSTATLKPFRELSGYKPDVVVLDEQKMGDEPRWEKQSTIVNGNSVVLAIEIASGNWQDDYELKLGDYELMGVQEYWIADYLGIAAARHIGKPKRPTLTICTLGEDGEYEIERFQGEDVIVSRGFPGLILTAAQILGAAQGTV
jgi:Uma2 family endonuclease